MPVGMEQLRNIAVTVVDIPKHFRLEMEDSVPKHHAEERCFIWEDPACDDNRIEVSLDLETGRLLRLKMDKADAAGSITENNKDLLAEAKAAAEAFVTRHHPEHSKLTWTRVRHDRDRITFTYRAEAGGLPLPDTGCEIAVDHTLNPVSYRAELEDILYPEYPDIVDQETVRRKLLREIQMKPAIVSLPSSLYLVEEHEPEDRLVYEPTPDLRFIDAATGEDLHSIDHYVMPESYPLPISSQCIDHFWAFAPVDADSITTLIDKWEGVLGIDPNRYELDKVKEDEERVFLFYKATGKEEETEEDGLSADAYMNRKWGNMLRNLTASHRITIEKSTGRLAGFYINTEEPDGPAALNRGQCWEEAKRFLQTVFPDYGAYLQLEKDKEEDELETRDREFFYLPVVIRGIPVQHHRVTIIVSTKTGRIKGYMGVSYDYIRMLASGGMRPAIGPEEALDIYAKSLRVELKWISERTEDEAGRGYRLVYVPVVHSVKRLASGDEASVKMRYIDACSGKPVWQRER
ncbi:YcdB/YcdC domain-containing protein [Paenibacillus sp. M1]|uniref:YcdB/YcdC domain-containing protein n=1 Tax=Paenibacillus haidiansis TaxID=1574488 RepID=A0ABU7VU08_9BACL